VFDANGKETSEFAAWKTRCLGRVVVQPEPLPNVNYMIPRWYTYTETEEDKVSYILTFDEKIWTPTIDVAAYYCPYVPLTSNGVIINSNTVE
jgi:hypothetical protein